MTTTFWRGVVIGCFSSATVGAAKMAFGDAAVTSPLFLYALPGIIVAVHGAMYWAANAIDRTMGRAP